MDVTNYRQLPYPEPGDPLRDVAGTVQALAEELDQPYVCTIYANGTQTVADNTSATLDLPMEALDPHGWADTANDRIRIGVAGHYIVQLELTWANNGAGYFQASVNYHPQGGAAQVIGTTYADASSWRTNTDVSTPPIPMAAGDYVSATIAQNTAGAVATTNQCNGPGGTTPRLSIRRVF